MKKNLNGKIATIFGVLLICLYGIFGIPHGVTGSALLDAIGAAHSPGARPARRRSPGAAGRGQGRGECGDR
jgi:hypothetical protein